MWNYLGPALDEVEKALNDVSPQRKKMLDSLLRSFTSVQNRGLRKALSHLYIEDTYSMRLLG